MRYVGRHRSPRPLLLRRPIIGGVAAAVVIAVPAWAVTGGPLSPSKPGNTTNASAKLADGTELPASTDEALEGADDGSGDTPSTGPTGSPSEAENDAPPVVVTTTTTDESGNEVVSTTTIKPDPTNDDDPTGSNPTKTTKKPTKTTTTRTTRPPTSGTTTTRPPSSTTTKPPVQTTTPKPPPSTTTKPPPSETTTTTKPDPPTTTTKDETTTSTTTTSTTTEADKPAAGPAGASVNAVTSSVRLTALVDLTDPTNVPVSL